MRKWMFFPLAVIASFVWSVATGTPPGTEPNHSAPDTFEMRPVIVELFTSEGCSSCPPADQVLSQLEQAQSIKGVKIIPLGFHVDYWNYIGWTDRYASSAFSERQRDYARALGRSGVYTPQMIVDGQVEFVGSHSEKASEAILRASRAPKATITIVHDPISRNSSGAQEVPVSIRIEQLPPLSAHDTSDVLLAITENDLVSQVTRGENAGHRLSHSAVVRQIETIGTISQQPSSPLTFQSKLRLAPDWKRSQLRIVVFVQERASRRVIGAGSTNLRAD